MDKKLRRKLAEKKKCGKHRLCGNTGSATNGCLKHNYGKHVCAAEDYQKNGFKNKDPKLNLDRRESDFSRWIL